MKAGTRVRWTPGPRTDGEPPEDLTGTVAAFDRAGLVDVEWDDGTNGVVSIIHLTEVTS